MASQAIATVAAVIGTAFARNEQGEMRAIKAGDVIMEGEVLVTPEGSSVELSLMDGSPLTVSGVEETLLTPDVVAQLAATAQDAAANQQTLDGLIAELRGADATSEQQQIQQALEGDGTLDDLLEATAAGLNGGGQNEGHSFVVLDRVNETVAAEGALLTDGAIAEGTQDQQAVVNLPPEVTAVDLGAMEEDGTITFTAEDLLVGSSDPEGTPLTVSNVVLTSGNGTLVDNGDGTYTFTPDPDWNGSVSFDFDVSDDLFTVPNTAALDVTPVNDAPEVGPITIVDTEVNDPEGNPVVGILEDSTIIITEAQLIASATDIDNTSEELSVVNVTADNGTITDNGDGTYTFTPDPDFNGEVTVNFEVSDGELSDTGSTTFTVVPVVDIVDDALQIDEDTPVIINVLNNDEFEGEGTVTSVTGPSNGTATVNADNTVTYVPNQDFVGEDTFTYTVTTEAGNTETATVTVTIVSSDNPANLGSGSGEVSEGGPLTDSGTISIDDPDAGENAFQVQTGTQGDYGSFNIDMNGNWTYTLDDSLNAVQALGVGDQLTEIFTVNSVDGTATSVVITINGTNDVPTITGDTGSVTEDTVLSTSGAVTIDDTDAGQSSFVPQENTTGTYGSFTLAANGAWTYTLDNASADVQALGEGDTLTESFAVTSFDGTATDTVVITINGTNDAPVFTLGEQTLGDDAGSVFEDEPLSASGTVAISDTDTDEEAFVAEDSTGDYGDFTIDENGDWTYNLDNNNEMVQALAEGETLEESFTVTTVDGSQTEVVITITGRNDAPVISVEDIAAVEDGEAITGNAGFTDLDVNNTHTYTVSSMPAGQGSVSIDAGTGEYTYNPGSDFQSLAAGETTTVSFDVTVTDNDGGSDTETVTVTITGTNDDPILTVGSLNANEDGASVSGTASFTDVDTSNTHTYTVSSMPAGQGSVSIDAGTGEYTYNPGSDFQSLAAGETTTVSFDVTVTDNDGGSDTETVTVTITGTNDDPILTVGSLNANEDGASVSGTASFTDVDTSNTHTYTVSSMPAGQGSVSIDAGTGEYTYNPGSDFQSLADGETTTVSFDVTVTDNDGGSDTETVTVTVTGIDDAPVISEGTGSVTEDTNVTSEGMLESSGQLTASDIDNPSLSFVAGTLAGTYGNLTIAEDGSWVYQADNSQDAIQLLHADQKVTETFTVTLSDGSTTTVDVDINGTLDTDSVVLTVDDVNEDADGVTFVATIGTPSIGETTITTDLGDIVIADGETIGELFVSTKDSDVYIDASEITATVTGVTSNVEQFNFEGVSATAAIADTTDITTVSLSTTDVTEDDVSVTFTATLSNAAETEVTVTTDLGDITIAAGDTTGTLVVNTQDSDVYLDADSLTATITGATGGNFESLTIGTASATAAIADTTDITTVSLSTTDVTEDDVSVTFTATLSNAAETEVTVTTDLGDITIAAGDTTGTLVVNTQDSDVYLDADSLTATITGATGGNFESLTIGTASATAAIADTTDITTVSLSTTDVTEDDVSVTFTATLSNAAETEVTVTTDLGDITIAAGDTTGTLVVNTQDSDVYLDADSLTATITGATGGNFESLTIGTASATAAIADTTDITTVSLSTTDVTEDDVSVTFTATLSNAAETEVTVTTDLGDITIAAGDTTGTLVVNTQDSDVYLDAGSLTATITGATGGNFESLTIGTASATAAIADTTDITTVSLSTTDVTEDDVSVTFTATLSNAAETEVTVTTDLGDITIAAGDTTGTLVVNTQDSDVYLDADSLTATITGATGGNFESLTIGTASATAAIADTTDITTVSLSTTDVTENDVSVTFTATLSNAAETEVTVTTDLGDITIAAGDTTGTLVVNTQDSDVYLDADSLTATITGATGGNFESLTIGTASATAAIADTTDTTVVTLYDVYVDENASTATIIAVVDHAPETDLVLTLSTSTNGVADTITILAGQTTGNTSVAVTSDGQTVSVSSTTGGNYENLNYSDTAIIDIDYTPEDLVDESLLSRIGNLSGQTASGNLFDPGVDGFGSVEISLETTGLFYNGVAVSTDNGWDPVTKTLTGSAGGTDVFTIEAIEGNDGTYDYNFTLLQQLDFTTTIDANFGDINVSGGNSKNVWIDSDGSFESDVANVTTPYAELSATEIKGGSPNPATINTNANGIGVGAGQSIGAGDTLTFDYSASGGVQSLVLGIGYGSSAVLTGSTSITYTIKYVGDSSTQDPENVTVTDNNNGDGLSIVSATGQAIESITIQNVSGDNFLITGVSSAAIISSETVNLEFSYTAEDLDGDAVVFDANSGDGHFEIALLPSVTGNSSNNTLSGSNADDFIQGGIGNDVLTGGLGDDVFAWTLADADGGQDTITDFGTGNDIIDISDLLTGTDATATGTNGVYQLSDVSGLLDNLSFTQSGSDTIMHIETGSVTQDILIEGFDISSYVSGGTLDTDQIITDMLNNSQLKVD